MNIEIANRLQKLRKEKGYSQEELADALGISRQAVSKWERAEASPDTDNLICLAKLYGVSLDDLLDTDETVDEIKEEQKEKIKEDSTRSAYKDENGFNVRDGGDFIHVGADGIHLKDEDGDEIHIDNKFVKAFDSNGKQVKCSLHRFTLSAYLEGVLMLCAAAGYILFGALADCWASAWILFLLPEIICSFVRCFEKKSPKEFNMPFLSTYVFFLVCMVHPGGLWHPMWVVFLAIPIFYTLVAPFGQNKREVWINGEKKTAYVQDDDDDDKDED